MKVQCLLNSYMYVYFIYMYRYNICIYIYIYIKEYLHVHKITLNENKMPTPLIKHTFTCWTRLKTEKILATAMQLIRKNYVSCLKNQTCFVHSLNVQISSTPSPCSFFCFLLTPPPFSSTNGLFEWLPTYWNHYWLLLDWNVWFYWLS